MQIFISYASEQQEKAERVCTYLESRGKRCWIAPRDIPAGTNYGEEIIKGIEGSDGFVLLFDASANESQHVLREVERAVSRKLPMVVCRLDDTVPSKSMEYFLLSIQWLDVRKEVQHFPELLDEAFERQPGTAKAPEDRQKAVLPAEGKQLAGTGTSVRSRLTLVAAVLLLLLIMLVLGMVQKAREEKKGEAVPTPVENRDNAGKEITASETPEADHKTELKTGDYVSFGRYMPGGEAAKAGEGEIEWQVVEAGTEGVLLVSTRILAIRPFDCAESGSFDRDSNGEVYDRNRADTYTLQQMREFRGSNRWEDSDLCAWLNAGGVVHYPGQVPQNGATDEHGNAFGAEAGFLTDFTKDEVALIERSGSGVFLLTKEQAEAYAADGSLRLETTPTEEAIAADETSWYRTYKAAGATDYIWATATAAEESACEIYYVDISLAKEKFGKKYAAAAGFGVRPAIRIFPENVSLEGDGSRQNPYRPAN